MSDVDDVEVTSELIPENITRDGKWRVSDGVEVEIAESTLNLPANRGSHEVLAIYLSPDEHFSSCPFCDAEPADGIVIAMEEWFYLAVWCCNQMLLYPKPGRAFGNTEELR